VAYDIATKSTDDEELQKRIVTETIRWLAENPDILEENPTFFHTYVSRLARRLTGNSDPFKPLKKASNEIALRVVPVLERQYREKDADEGFRLAALGTICGNSIDFEVEGYKVSVENLECSLLNCLKGTFAADDTAKLMAALSKARKVLYLLDNAGEIAFDKFFIKVITEKYPVKVVAAVKEAPILNDATMEDALQVNLGEAAEVITTGSDHIGLRLEEASEEFLAHLREADLIIAKGQGNYESMSGTERRIRKPVAYILRAKCGVVADALGVPQHGNVVKLVT
jgi:hypothetical protein